MEPQIRYTRTSDGVSIAYWVVGDGPPLLFIPPLPLHLQLDWRHPTLRGEYAWLSRRHQLVRFDFRGRGMSQRGELDYTHETELLDTEAVVRELGWDSFTLYTGGSGIGAAVRYAARNPGRVSQLVIANGFAPTTQRFESPHVRALTALLAVDFDIYCEVLAQMVYNWQGGPNVRQYAALLRASSSREQMMRQLGGAGRTREGIEDFMRSLPLITSPTLLVYHSDAQLVGGAEGAQSLAAEIPGARLVFLEGDVVGGAYNDPLLMAAVDEFLGDTSQTGRPSDLPSGMAVILFVDVESSTALTESMGDSAFHDASRALDDQVRSAVRSAGGTPIEGKVMGDGVMSVFSSASQAITAGRACHELSSASKLDLHIGLHAGDVIRDDNNVYGGAVNIASRICDASRPGEILVSATVRDLARTSANVQFEDRGERTLKGIDDPVRVFAVRSNV